MRRHHTPHPPHPVSCTPSADIQVILGSLGVCNTGARAVVQKELTPGSELSLPNLGDVTAPFSTLPKSVSISLNSPL